MKSTLIRSAILAARRNIEGGVGPEDYWQAVRDAYYATYRTLPAESTEEEKVQLQEAGDLVGDLLSFVAAIRGEMPQAPRLTPKWALNKDDES